jgi:universal stress protein A
MLTRNKIVYPTDFSTAAEVAFDTAQRLARDSQAVLLIVHVVDPATTPTAGPTAGMVPTPVAMGGVPLSETQRKALDKAGDELEKVVPSDPSIHFEHRLIEGDPGDQIPKLAEEEQADLIVMGTHGRSGLKRLLMGSVAESVVRRAKCPVLTLRQSASTFQDSDQSGDPYQTQAVHREGR